MFKILSNYMCRKKYCNIWRVAVRPSYIQDARFLKVKVCSSQWRRIHANCVRPANTSKMTSAHVTQHNRYSTKAAATTHKTNNPSTREKLVCSLFTGIVICLDLEFNRDQQLLNEKKEPSPWQLLAFISTIKLGVCGKADDEWGICRVPQCRTA